MLMQMPRDQLVIPSLLENSCDFDIPAAYCVA